MKYGVVDDEGSLHYGLGQGDAENLAAQMGWGLVVILPIEDFPQTTYAVSYFSDGTMPITKHFDDPDKAAAFYERVASDSWKSGAKLVRATVLKRGAVR